MKENETIKLGDKSIIEPIFNKQINKVTSLLAAWRKRWHFEGNNSCMGYA